MPVSERLGGYLKRIGLASPPPADAAGLSLVQQAQRLAIPFENLDIQLGRPIRLDSEAVFAKLVTGGRGGYCFEQNRLLADMLDLLDIANRPLLARPQLRTDPAIIPPRTHMLLLVDLAGEMLIADAGFGGSSIPALPLRDGTEAQTSDGARHRLRMEGGDWLLERAGPRDTTDGRALDHGDWQAQYRFDLASVAPMDLEQANHWTATYPQSRFVLSPIVSRVLPNGFASMTGTEVNIKDAAGEAVTRREIEDTADMQRTLAHTFGIKLSAAESAQVLARAKLAPKVN